MRVFPSLGLLSATALLATGCVHTTTSISERSQQGLRVTYRVDDPTTTPPSARREVVETASPYLASQLTYDADSDAAKLVGGFVWTRESLFTVSDDGSVQTTQNIPPAPAPPAAHLLVALPLAEQQKLAVHDTARAATTMLGRTCTWWKTKDPLDGAELNAPSTSDHVDSCVDDEGVVLVEQWYIDGKLARTRTAIKLEPIKAIQTADLFNGASPKPIPDGLASDAVMDIEIGAQSQGVTIKAPAGYSLDRAVSVASAIPGEPITQIASIGEADAFRKGNELMTFKRIRNLLGDPLVADKGADVDLGALGTGHLEPTSTGCQVTVVTKQGILVVAQSTGDPDALVAWVRTAVIAAPSPSPSATS